MNCTLFVNVHATMNYEKNCIDVTIQDINFYTLGDEDKLCLIMSNQHITYQLAWFVQTAWNERQNILYNK